MDRTMRDLERRARTGDPEAEVALLRRRLMTRDLRRKKLRLAAYLGHAPAEEVHAEYLRRKDQRFDKWIRGLRHFGGPQAAVRVALSGVGLLMPFWVEVYPKDARPQRAFDLALATLTDPTEERLAELERAAVGAEAARRDPDRYRESRDTSLRGVAVRRALCAAMGAEHVAQLVRMCANPGDIATRFTWIYEHAVRAAVDGTSEAAVRRQVKRDLLAWALG